MLCVEGLAVAAGQERAWVSRDEMRLKGGLRVRSPEGGRE